MAGELGGDVGGRVSGATRRTRPASIRDVARAAGVSPGTASKVLNGRGELKEETRRRVLAAADELEYRPNELVRGIFGRRSYTVGLITSDSFGRFSGPIMAGAEDALGRDELSVIMCDSRGDREREASHMATLMGRRVDGVIVTGRCSNTRPPLGRNLPFPVVYAHTPSCDPADLSVVVDDEGAARLAARHLVEVGRRRIAHITGPWDFDAVQLRHRGLVSELEALGLELVGEPLGRDWSEAWGRAAAAQIMESHPDVDAIYCGSDLLGRGVADALRESGVTVPDDVALVGTDNWALIARATRPALTSVDMSLWQVGREAALSLVAAIEGGELARGQLRIPAELVVRASTGLPYISDQPTADSYHDSCIH